MANIESDRRLLAALAANAAQRRSSCSRSWAYVFAACLLLAGSAAPAPAPTRDPKELKNLTLEELGDVKVTTASKQPEQVWNTSAAIFVITQEDIRRSGVTNIPDALRLAPGVEVARVNGGRNWAVGIRGFGDQFSKGVLVLIDGRNVYTPLFAGVLWTLDNVMLEDIDRIEVIRGPGGTIWGTNAVNGVINIITKSSKDTHGALVSAGGGNVDQGTGDIRYGGGRGNFDYRMYAMGWVRSAEFHTDRNNYDASRLGQIGFRTDWTPNNHDAFTLQGDTYRGSIGDAQSISSFTPPANFISFEPTVAYGGNVLGRWRRDLGEGSNLYLQGYWDHTFRIGSNFGETRDTFDIDFLHRLREYRRNQFTWGFGARLSPSTYKTTAPPLEFFPHDKTSSIYTGFLQDELTVVPHRLTLTGGAKLEHNNYTGFNVQPSGRLLWTPTEHQSFWAAVTRALRIPSRVDEDIDVNLVIPGPPIIVGEVLGSHSLAPEQLIGYELGYRALLHPTFYFDIATFYNHYDDVVALAPPVISPSTAPPLPPHLLVLFNTANAISGDTKGFEISPNWRPSPVWELKGSYSYLHMSMSAKPGFEKSSTLSNLQGSSPVHQVVLQSRFNLGKQFEFDQTYRYVSALPAQLVSAYNTADLRAGWHPAKQLEFSLSGENLFQPHHAEFGINPPPTVFIKRSVYAKVVWTR
jgi:iron complex outermembrane receptor protein